MVVAAWLAGPASAGVAELELYEVGTRDGGKGTVARVVYTAGPGEANRLTVTYFREPGLIDDREAVMFRDTGGVVAGSGCSKAGDQEVRCDFDGAAPGELRIALGDQPDMASIAGNYPYGLQGVPVGAVISGGPGDDRLEAGAAYRVGALYGVLDGGAGDDVLTAGDPVEFGQGFEFRGGAGNDRMAGGSEEDRFVADSTRDGLDTMIGGGQSDTVSYEARSRRIRADLEGDRDDGARGERDRIAKDVENLIGGAGSDRLFGDRRGNALRAGDGRDLLVGRGGDDHLDGVTSPVQDVSATGGDRIVAGPGDDAVAAGMGDDVIDGGPGEDRVFGNAGDDEIDLRDGARDEGSCGDGRDHILLDQFDYVSKRGWGRCEAPERARVPPAQ